MPARSRRSDVTNQVQYSPAGVAAQLKIDERTVRRWVATGLIPADETTATGHYFVSESTLQVLQQLVKAKVPLNARTLRGRFDQQSLIQEVRPQPKAN